MSNETTTTGSRKPTHLAYSVREYRKQNQMQSEWTRIGVAWQHKDGEGFDIVLECLPVNGRVALRTNKPKPEQEQAPEQSPEQA